MRRTVRLWAIAAVVAWAAVLGGALVIYLDLEEEQEYHVGTPYHAEVPTGEMATLLVVATSALPATVAAEVSRRRTPIDLPNTRHPDMGRLTTSDVR